MKCNDLFKLLMQNVSRYHEIISKEVIYLRIYLSN